MLALPDGELIDWSVLGDTGSYGNLEACECCPVG